ncbi:MAG: C69 family dipeptidase, partial [Erysipelotrichaceae bacterium]|nr:C69 family dipeptidase [Erysipelotrichaceae bacterium]
EATGGIGEEDLVYIVLPYIHTAREGVIRTGELLEKYGTYEANGMAFNDENEIWWLETIGGHHWIAKRVPDDSYVIMPNQFGLDNFDLEDAFGAQKNHMCSKDLKEFIADNHLDLNMDGKCNPRLIFGSHDDSDHVYNTPRSWFMARYFNPRTYKWDGPDADFTPESDDIPWSLVPEHKITVEELKYILSSYYQGTPYNPYSNQDTGKKGVYRPIGIGRTGCMAILQIRGYMPDAIKAIEWMCFGPNSFNAALPVYTNVAKMPDYLSKVTLDATTDNFYWQSRYIAALADPFFATAIQMVERYQKAIANKGHELINVYDKKFKETGDLKVLDEANKKLCVEANAISQQTLNQLILNASK